MELTTAATPEYSAQDSQALIRELPSLSHITLD